MRVVKEGRVSKPLKNLKKWAIKVVCKKFDRYDSGGCGAVLEVGFKDLLLMCWKASFNKYYYTGFRCPRCDKYNRVLDVPEVVLNKVNTSKRRKTAIFDGFSDRD